jgi:hypothetical protein
MNKGATKKLLVLVGFALALLVAFSPADLIAQNVAKGNIIGFIYAKDGTTPLEGAIVKFKSLGSGAIFESSKSDNLGIFKVQGVETGMYTYGVLTETGDFNADNLVGIRIGENETAKLSIALNPYEKDVASAVGELNKENPVDGEVLVGAIADFDPATSVAQVQVVKGLLRIKDKIHARGKSTDFYQDVEILKIGDSSTKQVISGQTASTKLVQKAQSGDLIYVVRNKKVFPFFLAPAGVAAVIAGNSAVTYGVVKIKDEGDPASAFKNQ